MKYLMIALTAVIVAFTGCSVERHYISAPGRNQVVRVESGDRLFMELEEDVAAGCSWDYKCDDSDVEVVIDHHNGKAEVMIRIHRGYDGPSTIVFTYKNRNGTNTGKQFTIALFKRTGDCAFWE